ncbi:uncharacterized protein LOC120002847 isoform X2 [Tripterygium wilfordii]|uniref:uncharacterized protein LOC120002847 isoform X2 n=1 Tax=Tripterygium wilfordii TaxID=458696 RepID=UPI0018F817CB|nr:uncharacterized protein LOC120002847 isoform X2 [Tripterygium wilfordii]
MQVCHVIVFIQEGSCFDTQNLKKFHVLQAAKNALTRSRTSPPSLSRPLSSLSSSKPTGFTSSSNSSPGRSRAILTRNSSSISLMSGLGSYTSLFPGQCTPITLFVFIDDFSDVSNPTSTVEDLTDTSSINKSSSLSSSARPTSSMKGSGSVVVLARPVSKSEGGTRKKLQSSLETQARLLLKKCRTLSVSESSHSRSGSVSSAAPLFALDASRAVVLLDRSMNQRGEPLEFVSDLLEVVLNGKATSDFLLLESHSQSANKEDLISVKEFIYRQSDLLRGRGGLVANNNSGSAAGVGMVAIAAAAAAASAASGKRFTAPELPSLETWLSSSHLILHDLLSPKEVRIDETDIGRRKPHQGNTGPAHVEEATTDSLDLAVSWLSTGRGLNTSFSTLCCERSLPAARDVYLKDLPVCYPTLQHKAHLEKALNAFHSRARGPAVPLFAKKLENECISLWKSGRQLCDAISLTGRPCINQKHDVESGESHLGAEVKPHSSGYFFLHACACGRSRCLQPDPFDFESANLTFSFFPECDKLLPAVSLPEVSHSGPIRPSSWSLVRIGSARYYGPSKGLLQSGFCATHKFLLKWTIFLEKPKITNEVPPKVLQRGLVLRSDSHSRAEFNRDSDVKKISAAPLYSEDIQLGTESRRKPLENNFDDKRISFGNGLPNFTMRKPFSEVVAGSAATQSGFPPLQQMRHSSSGSEKSNKQNRVRDQSVEQDLVAVDQGSHNPVDTVPVQETLVGISSNYCANVDPFLRIGSNVVPVNVNNGEKARVNPSMKHATVYVGFEHECPHGHRFLLNPGHLNELGPKYSFLGEDRDPSEHSLADSSKLGKNDVQGKVHQSIDGMTGGTVNKIRNIDKSKEIVPNGCLNGNRQIKFCGLGKEQSQISLNIGENPDFVKDLASNLLLFSLDDGGSAFSMLNRNLPLYMNCPHCRHAQSKKYKPKTKFAGAISQLQRIFLVTPPLPLVLATCPVIQFEASCVPLTVPDCEQKLQFSLGCQVVLPPESFLALRLPFVYGLQLEDGSLHPVSAFEHQPELTAWITKGTTLQVLSKGSEELNT